MQIRQISRCLQEKSRSLKVRKLHRSTKLERQPQKSNPTASKTTCAVLKGLKIHLQEQEFWNNGSNEIKYIIFRKNLICFKDALEKSLIQDEESIMISTKIDPNITIGKHTEVIGLTDFKKRPNYLDFDIIHEIIKLAEITERKQNPSSSASTMNLLRVLNAYKAVFKQKGVSANIVCSYIYRLHPLKILFIIEY